MIRPRLLDLFCGAGGSAVGYHRAGFDVVGVDNRPQPHYPFEFVRADAMTFPLDGYDAIHASPPCQFYSKMTPPAARDRHPDLVAPTRARLMATGAMWVLENVPGSPVASQPTLDGQAAVSLCGCMFSLGASYYGRWFAIYRERWFETSVLFSQPSHRPHDWFYLPAEGHGADSWFVAKHGFDPGVAMLRDAMQMPWATREGIVQAIPPAYTEYIGAMLLDHLKERAA